MDKHSLASLGSNVSRLLFVLALHSSVGVCAPGVEGTMKKWHKISVTFTHDEVLGEASAENPFLDFRLWVYFHHPASGALYRVPGFFAADGDAANTSATDGDKWRCHFAPDHSGAWVYLATFVTGPGVAIDDTLTAGTPVSFDGTIGAFDVGPADPSAPGLRAKGRLEYVGGHHLRFAETHERFLKSGADSPENLLGYYEFDNTYDLGGQSNDLHLGDGLHHFDPHLGDFKTSDPTWLGGTAAPKGQRIIGAMNYLRSKVVNAVYFLTYNIDQGDGAEVWPWVTPTERLRFDVSKLAQWEILFDHMTDLGMQLHVITQETENDHAIDSGNLGTARKLYYRELIARFGHNLAVNWNLGEENTNSDAQRKAFADYIRATDPYDHPITVHTFPYQIDSVYTPLLGYPTLNGPSLQIDMGSVHARTIQFIDSSAAIGHPWVVNSDEQTPADAGVKPDADDFWHDIPRKTALWGNLMAQGGGCEWYFGYAYPHSDLDCEDFRSRDHMWDLTRIAVGFFQEHLPFWQMSHADALTSSTTDYVMASPDDVYAVYRRWGGSATLDLGASNHTFTVRWYDPRLGGALTTGSVAEISGPGVVSIGDPPPGGDDWLALVRRKDNRPPVVHDSVVDLVKLGATASLLVKVHSSDPDGKQDIAAVDVYFVHAASGAVLHAPCEYAGGDAYMLYAEGFPLALSGTTWNTYAVSRDYSGAIDVVSDVLVVP